MVIGLATISSSSTPPHTIPIKTSNTGRCIKALVISCPRTSARTRFLGMCLNRAISYSALSLNFSSTLYIRLQRLFSHFLLEHFGVDEEGESALIQHPMAPCLPHAASAAWLTLLDNVIPALPPLNYKTWRTYNRPGWTKSFQTPKGQAKVPVVYKEFLDQIRDLCTKLVDRHLRCRPHQRSRLYRNERKILFIKKYGCEMKHSDNTSIQAWFTKDKTVFSLHSMDWGWTWKGLKPVHLLYQYYDCMFHPAP